MLIVSSAALSPREVETGKTYLISISVAEIESFWGDLKNEIPTWQVLKNNYTTWKQVKQR